MTQAIPVTVRRVEKTLDLAADIRQAEALAKLMDAQFEVGGIKFGLDALVGIVPILGDALTSVASLYPIYIARKHNLGRVVISRMLINIGIDFGIGLVPIAGDLIDVMHKANLKNVALLKKAASKRGI